MREDLAWAAGLFEGEGSVFQRRGSVVASVTMTDEDRIEALHAIFPFGTVIEVPPQRPGHKPGWKWAASSFEGAQAVAAMLWPWLGVRRRAAFASAIAGATPYRHARHTRRRCLECGLVTSAGPLGMHQKQKSHDGYEVAA